MKRSVAAKTVQSPERLQERILNDVLRRIVIVHEGQRHTVRRPVMPLHQRTQCGVVPGSASVDQFAIGWLHAQPLVVPH